MTKKEFSSFSEKEEGRKSFVISEEKADRGTSS